MKKNTSFILALLVLGSILSLFLFTQNQNKIKISKTKNALSNAKGEITNFSLLDQEGNYHDLYQHSDAKAVVIIGQANGCPLDNKESSSLNQLKEKLELKKIALFMINPNIEETRPLIQKEVSANHYPIPVLMDPSQTVTESLGITRAREVVVIDPHGWKIIYRGTLEDKLFHSMITDKPLPDSDNSKSSDCLFSFKEPVSLSYEKTVAPIIAEKCLNCHSELTRSTSYLPLLNSHQKFKSWLSMSRETILSNRMPPFGADLYYGEYHNNFSLSPEQKRILIKWMDAGAIQDGTIDPLSQYKEKIKYVKKRTPLYVATADKPVLIPPQGTVEYLFTQIGGPVPHDMWLSGINTISLNPKQIHHAALMITSRPLSFFNKLIDKRHPERNALVKENIDGDIPVFTLQEIQDYEKMHGDKSYFRVQVWGAGKSQPFFFGKNSGVFVEKGSFLILETHYMGSGKTEKENMTMEFFGHKTKPPGFRRMFSKKLVSTRIDIPPMVKDHVVSTRSELVDKDMKLVSVLAHLHMRGKSVKFFMTTPEGETKIFMSLPNYYYGWQTGIVLSPIEPLLIKKDSVLWAECHYDNSPQNPNNPDPSKNVLFGQTVDRTEMCKMSLNYVE